MAPINNADLLTKTSIEVRFLGPVPPSERQSLASKADLMPRSLALSILAGTLLGAAFWGAVAALILR